MTNPLFARSIRYANYAIVLLLAAGLGVVCVVRLAAPAAAFGQPSQAAVSEPVSVSFDALGVPHIRAASLEDALFVQGYVTAQDRLCQMDLLRRFAAGELAEVFGPAALEADRDSRRLRLRRIAEDAYTHLPPADRAAFAAYTRGVNAFIASHLDNLPLEFTLARLSAAPLERGGFAAGLPHMFRDLTTTWNDEIVKRTMLAAGDRGQSEFPVSAAIGRRATARIERVGHRRQPHRFGKTAAFERHAPGVFDARDLVHDAARGSRTGCFRRRASRRARHHCGP